MKEYEPKSGLGTIMSLMLPYTLTFLGIWIMMLIVFGVPLGPGVYMYLYIKIPFYSEEGFRVRVSNTIK